MKPKAKAPREGKRIPSSKVHPPHVRALKAERRAPSPDVVISDTGLDQAVKNVGKLGAPKKHMSVEKLTVEKEGTEIDKERAKKDRARQFKF